MRERKDYILLVLKGMAMGAADVVPGVSGGTIAFITGIYEELIATISAVNIDALRVLKEKGIKEAWKAINGNFIASIFIGIAISIASLAKLITYLLENEPVLLWSFFFGLVFASILYVGRQVKEWNFSTIISLNIGAFAAYYVTTLPPMAQNDSLPYIFFSGMIAICAMILPGISGSFILLILGSYQTVLHAVKNIEIAKLFTFITGCVVGLLAFSRALKWMFAKHHDLTVALLSGFLIGSLNKIWPWKHIEQYRLNSHGEWVPYLDTNVNPSNYDVPVFSSLNEQGIPELYKNADSQILYALLFCLVGFVLIFGMEGLAKKMNKK